MELNFVNEKKEFLFQKWEELTHLHGDWVKQRPAPKKWSAVEILGHLVDSAINNLTRFVNASYQQNLIFPGYDQDLWVQQQNYREADWVEVLTLWLLLNKQIITVIQNIPDELCEKLQAQHNFDQIAFRTVEKDQSVSLKYLIDDYYLHMAHHLDQIFNLKHLLGG